MATEESLSITTPAEIERTKACKTCGLTLPLGSFHRGDGRFGRQANCRSCHAAKDAARYWADPETAREKARRQRDANRDVYRAHGRKSYHKRRDGVLATKRAGYAANSEKFRALSAEYRKAKPWVSLIGKARRRATEKGLPFNLDSEWGAASWTGRCAVTGALFQPERGRMWSASIDRIIPALGYVQANCRFVFWSVNCLKNDGSDSDMREIARLIAGASRG
jgi:hypothetical protein